jgi:hypothetical protein
MQYNKFFIYKFKFIDENNNTNESFMLNRTGFKL